MGSSKTVALIPERLDDYEALSVIEDIAGGARVAVDGKVFYPYHWYRASGSAPGLFGRQPIDLNCLVDACNGMAGTADRFDLETRAVERASLLQARQRSCDTGAAARRYVTHALGRSLRTIANFRIDLDHRGIVYKPFWVFGCGDRRMLVDGVNGAHCPILRA